MNPALLEAQELAIGYPGREVGRGFSLSLTPGRVLALLGPNGGGKTTLLKTLLGLLPPRGGEVLLEGQPLARWPMRERARRLAYVPQAGATPFDYSVADVVLMGRNAHAGLLSPPGERDRAAATAAIDRLGLTPLAHRPVTRISGGERQLVLVARALAQEARVVVLDEPTASLDFGNQGKLLREIRRLAGGGLAVLFSTHDPNHALRAADDALLVQGGRTLTQGPVAAVLQPDTLARLYGAPVDTLLAPEGRRAFLPG